jgi:hypothetical protein
MLAASKAVNPWRGLDKSCPARALEQTRVNPDKNSRVFLTMLFARDSIPIMM